MADRKERVKAIIRKNLSEIIQREISSSKVGLVSINEIDVIHDFSYAKVYVSFLGVKYQTQALEELNKSKGYIRSCLSKSLDIYKTPDIVFVLDKKFESIDKIENALKK